MKAKNEARACEKAKINANPWFCGETAGHLPFE
jgi:hypothetical protein